MRGCVFGSSMCEDLECYREIIRGGEEGPPCVGETSDRAGVHLDVLGWGGVGGERGLVGVRKGLERG